MKSDFQCLLAVFIAALTAAFSACSPSINQGFKTVHLDANPFPSSTPSIGPAAKLVFSLEPSSSGNSGVVLPSQPAVQVQDTRGNVMTTASNSISLAAFTDSSCTVAATGVLVMASNPLAAVSGSASFSGLNYSGTAGTTLYLKASSSGLSSACSSVTVIGAGNAAKLVFSTAPSALVVSRMPFATQPVVQAEDSAGNSASTFTSAVTLNAFTDSACTNADAGALSAAVNPLSATSGTASFAGVSYAFAGLPGGTIYLKASSSGLTSACAPAVVMDIRSVSEGQDGHACALASSGNIYCWGSGSRGSLGNGGTSRSSTPVEVLGVGGVGVLSGIVSISSGYDNTCALSSAGNVYCWGNNSDGNLGNNTTTDSYTPVEVLGVGGSGFLSNIIAVSAGHLTTCALSSSGNSYCWGDNSYGELGINSTTSSSTPVEVLGVGGSGVLSNLVGITIGEYTTCAFSSTGAAYCWGYNGFGELGVNSTSNSSTPLQVMGVGGSGFLSGVIAISSGYYTSCASVISGKVYCWGENNDGQLGINTTSASHTPVEVLGVGGSGVLSGMISVSVGAYGACANSVSGNGYCWGSNSSGQLGNNSTTSSSTPVEISGVGGSGILTGVTSLTTEGGSSCATLNNGTAYCWGSNTFGQIGNNTTYASSTPLQVFSVDQAGYLSGISSISKGENGGCAVSSAGNVYCWGQGYLGRGNTETSLIPIEVMGVGGVGYLSGITAVSVGQSSTCALSSSQNVYCWGSGVVGDGTTNTDVYPIEVVGVGGSGFLSNITSITGNVYDTCAVSSGGNVYCWGLNYNGEDGNNTDSQILTPTEVLDVSGTGQLSNIIAVTAQDLTTCALSSVGNVYCWGLGYYGGLGNNSTSDSYIPVEVSGVGGSGTLSGIVALSNGTVQNNSTCAISGAGNVYCWGLNQAGELGDNSTSNSATPVEVVGSGASGFLSGVTAVASGTYSACGISGGNVFCWGQVGMEPDDSTPTEVSGVGGSGNLSGMTAVALSSAVGCALSSAGNVYCWGGNGFDTLGNGTTSTSANPVQVSGAYSGGYLGL